jgi:hypothetical protein
VAKVHNILLTDLEIFFFLNGLHKQMQIRVISNNLIQFYATKRKNIYYYYEFQINKKRKIKQENCANIQVNRFFFCFFCIKIRPHKFNISELNEDY